VALRARVSRFGEPEVLRIEEFSPRQRPRRRTVRVRVTHASVGSTDAAARSGGYLLQPRPGFVPGYDFVGILETGMRVAGCLARMGGYATQVDVPPDRLVPLPDALDSASAAALPLDLVTTELALELAHLPSGATIFMQGVSGSVGALITQRAVAEGMTVVGTASDRTRSFAEALGARVVDYHDPDWPARVRELTSGGADASIDHTGGKLVRSATAQSGTVVRTAWTGRIDAVLGGPATIARRYAHPRERICSVPMLVALRPAKYRQMLQGDLNRIVDGSLRGPAVTTVPFAEVVDAHRRLASLPPGHKLVLEMP
jgi:NADPH:quinone reductase